MFYIALSIVLIYLIISFIRFKQIPESISNTFYLGNKWWFSAVMIILGFLITTSLLNVTSEYYQCFAFFTGAGLLFVGAAPHFKEDLEGKVHTGGAIIFGIASQVWASIYFTPWLLLTWLTVPIWFKTKQRTFWAEILCIINIIIAYLLG